MHVSPVTDINKKNIGKRLALSLGCLLLLFFLLKVIYLLRQLSNKPLLTIVNNLDGPGWQAIFTHAVRGLIAHCLTITSRQGLCLNHLHQHIRLPCVNLWVYVSLCLLWCVLVTDGPLAWGKWKGILFWRKTVRETVLSFNTGLVGGKKMTNSHRLMVYEREPWQRRHSVCTLFQPGCRIHTLSMVFHHLWCVRWTIHPSLSPPYLCHGSNQFSCDILFFCGFAGFLVNI